MIRNRFLFRSRLLEPRRRLVHCNLNQLHVHIHLLHASGRIPINLQKLDVEATSALVAVVTHSSGPTTRPCLYEDFINFSDGTRVPSHFGTDQWRSRASIQSETTIPKEGLITTNHGLEQRMFCDRYYRMLNLHLECLHLSTWHPVQVPLAKVFYGIGTPTFTPRYTY